MSAFVSYVRYVLCWIGHWTVPGDDIGSRHKNETACDDQTPTHLHSPLLTDVNHKEICLS